MPIDLDRPVPDSDPRPEICTVDRSMPPDVLQSAVEWLRRNPSPPGADLTGILERFNLGVPEAAAGLGFESADLADILAPRCPLRSISRYGWRQAGIRPRGGCAGRSTTMSPRSGRGARGRYRERPVPSLCRRECLPRRQPRRSEQPRLNSDSAPAGARSSPGGDGGEGRKDALDALVGALQMGVAADKRSPQGANAPVYEDP